MRSMITPDCTKRLNIRPEQGFTSTSCNLN